MDVFQQWIDLPLGTSDKEMLFNEEHLHVQEVVKSIDDEAYSIPQLVKDMEPYLTSETDLPTTARALSLLPRVFSNIKTQPSRQDTHSLVEYFCSRFDNVSGDLNNRAGIQEVTQALLAIVKWKRFLSDDAALISRSVFGLATGSTFMNLEPKKRLSLFELVDYLFRTHSTKLRKEIDDKALIDGLLSMAQPEKNPACLKLLFTLYSHLSKEWDLSQDGLHEIFQSYVRYYPAEIGGNDSTAAIKKELNDMLLQCFFSNKNYAEEAFPRYVQMLETGNSLSVKSKIQVFETIEMLATKYPAVKVEPFAFQLWNSSLKFEIWNDEEDRDLVIDSVLKALHSIVLSLSQLALPRSTLASFIDETVKECLDSLWRNLESFSKAAKSNSGPLCNAKRKEFYVTGRILNAMATSSPAAFELVATQALPEIVAKFADLHSCSHTKEQLLVQMPIKTMEETEMIIAVLNEILRAGLAHPGSSSQQIFFAEAVRVTLEPYARSLWHLCSMVWTESIELAALFERGLFSTKVLTSSIQGLVLLFRIPGDSWQGFLKENFDEMVRSVLDPTMNWKELKDSLIYGLHEISLIYPRWTQQSIAKVTEELPETLSNASSYEEYKNHEKVTTEYLGYLLRIIRPSKRLSADRIAEIMPIVLENYNELVQALLNKWKEAVEKINAPMQSQFLTCILRAVYMGLEDLEKVFAALPKGLATKGPYMKRAPIDCFSKFLMTHMVQFVTYPHGREDEFSIGSPQVQVKQDLLDLEEYTPEHARVMASNDPTLQWEAPERAYEKLDVLVEAAARIAMVELRANFIDPEENYLRVWNRLPTTSSKRNSLVYALFQENIDLNQLNLPTPHQPFEFYQHDLQSANKAKRSSFIMSAHIIAGTSAQDKNELNISMGDTAARAMKNCVLMKSTSVFHSATVMALQQLVNKCGAAREVIVAGQSKGKKVSELLEDYIETITNKEDFDRLPVIKMVAAFATAALARLDPSIRTIIPKMVELLADAKYGAIVADSFFRALLAPSANLCIENGNIISKLREIRLFSLAVLPIARKWQSSLEDTYKRNYFIAIAAMIEHMPATAFLVEENIDLMFIVVLEGSLCEDDHAKSVYLKILPQLNDLFPRQAEDHLETITVRMTDPFIPKCIAGTYWGVQENEPESEAGCTSAIVITDCLAGWFTEGTESSRAAEARALAGGVDGTNVTSLIEHLIEQYHAGNLVHFGPK